MQDFEFRPEVLVIRAGTAVIFANKDKAQHTATSDTGVGDSGYLAKGEEFCFHLYRARNLSLLLHPYGGPGGQGMAATIIVMKWALFPRQPVPAELWRRGLPGDS